MAERQISEVEFLRRFRPDEYERRRQLGLYSAASPQPAAIPGLPPPDEIASELAYAASFADTSGRGDGDRLLRRVTPGGGLAGGAKTRLPRANRDERTTFERRDAEIALADQLARTRVADILAAASARPAAETAQLAADAVSEVAGRPVSATLAARAASYSQILDLPLPQALALAESEAQLDPGAPLRAQKQALDPALLAAAAESGELTADPAARAVATALQDGVLDPTTPVDAQQAALDPYLQAARDVATRSGEPLRSLDEREVAQMAAAGGYGRKLPGGRRNPFDKASGGGPQDPFLVPALLASATEPYTTRAGVRGLQPPTVQLGGERRYDPRQVALALLDPRAELPADLGYLRAAAPSKEVSGGVGTAVGAPTPDWLGGELHGLRAQDDPAAVRDSVPMTLGQAAQDIIYRNRTPLAEIPHQDVLELPDGRLLHRQTRQTLFPARQQSGGSESATYRIGSNSEYRREAFQEFGQLIEQLSGQRPIVNEKLRDPGLWALQQQALARSLPAEALGEDGKNPTYALMRALAAGAALPPADTAVQPVLRQHRELDFYRQQLGPQMEQLREGVRQAAATQQLAAAQPRTASINTSAVSELNAPASQPLPPSPELLAQVPEAVRPNLEASFSAPAGSPRQRAAVDFLARFLGRARG